MEPVNEAAVMAALAQSNGSKLFSRLLRNTSRSGFIAPKFWV